MEPIQHNWAEVARKIGLVCRGMRCCCPPGQGHRHPAYDQYLAHLDRAEQGAYVPRSARGPR